VRRTTASDGLGIVRPLLLGVVALGCVGTESELLLLGHTEETTQWIPVVLLGLGTLGVAALALRPSGALTRLFRGLMGLFIGAGALGIVLHYRGNAEFELEMRSSMAGWELFWNSLTGATPTLAPGSLVPLGLVGIIATLRHPATRRRSGASTVREQDWKEAKD